VSSGRALALAAGLGCWALSGAGPAAAQAVAVPILPPQPARYLLTTEAADARAVWVSPAGLARRLEASLGADVTADRFRPGGTRLSQYGATIASRGVAAAWVHNRYPSGPPLDAYVVGFGLGDEQFSAGLSKQWFRGVLLGSAWNASARVATGDGTQLSLVAKNLGSPRLSDSTFLGASLVPGALVSLLGSRLQAAGEWEVATRRWRSMEFRVGGAVALAAGVALWVRADLAPDFKRRGFAVALTFEAPQARGGAFVLLPGGASEVDAVGASGSLVGRPAPARR
jgi:hypothetical protein